MVNICVRAIFVIKFNVGKNVGKTIIEDSGVKDKCGLKDGTTFNKV
jgi:hypothetical protein